MYIYASRVGVEGNIESGMIKAFEDTKLLHIKAVIFICMRCNLDIVRSI